MIPLTPGLVAPSADGVWPDHTMGAFLLARGADGTWTVTVYQRQDN